MAIRIGDDSIVFGNSRIELRFSKATGAWTGLRDKATNRQFLGHGEETPAALITVGGQTTEFTGRKHIWSIQGALTIGRHAVCIGHDIRRHEGGNQLTIRVKDGDWIVATTYLLHSLPDGQAHVERGLEIEYQGEGEQLLRYAWLTVPGISVGEVDDCLIELPGYNIEPHVPLWELPQGRWSQLCSQPDWGVPDWQLGLLVVHDRRSANCLMTWPYGEEEPVLVGLERVGDSLSAVHEILIADRFQRGHRVQWAAQHVRLCDGGYEQALRGFHEWYNNAGIRVPADIPEWARGFKSCEVFIGTKGSRNGRPYRQFADVDQLVGKLPYIRGLGFNTIQLMPQAPYPTYSVHDYFDVATHYGATPDGLSKLVKAAHQMHLKVILDVVMHGCREGTRYISEHPEWFVRDEQGRIARTYTYAFDHADPQWREFFISVLLHYVKAFDVDGFRVDAVTWNFFPNWREGLPYRASKSMYGSVELFGQARRRLKELKGDVVLYTETPGALFSRTFDLSYNYDEQWLCKALLPVLSDRGFAEVFPTDRKITAHQAMDWYEARRLALPEGVIRVHHLDSHDTHEWGSLGMFRKEAFGQPAGRAMFAFFALQGGGLMNYLGSEEGSEDFYRKVIAIRDRLSGGEVSFTALRATDPNVFSPLWRQGEKLTAVLINLQDRIASFQVQSPNPLCRNLTYALTELLSESDLGRIDQEQFAGSSITLAPYEVKVLSFTPLDWSP